MSDDNDIEIEDIDNDDVNDIKDALIYASIQNIITPNNFLNLDARYWKADDKGNPIDTSKVDGYINFTTELGITSGNRDSDLQKLINNTTLKRACCLRDEDPENNKNYLVTVKLPYVDSAVPGTDILKNILYKRYGFMNKIVSVPKTICNSSELSNYIGPDANDGNTKNCDKFYKLYCENVKHIYNNLVKQNNEKYNSADLKTYAPDCACFMDTPQPNTKVQPACYAPGCLTGSKNIYRDRETREKGACTINQCTTIQNFDSIIAKDGGSIGLSTPINQTCGEYAASKGTPNPTTALEKELAEEMDDSDKKDDKKDDKKKSDKSGDSPNSDDSIDTSNISLYIGIGVGICIIIMIVVGVGLYLSKRKSAKIKKQIK
jgi:hypothetical protein